MWAILCTNREEKYSIYGPFTTERAVITAQETIDRYTDLDTEIISMTKFNRSEFSIYSE